MLRKSLLYWQWSSWVSLYLTGMSLLNKYRPKCAIYPSNWQSYNASRIQAKAFMRRPPACWTCWISTHDKNKTIFIFNQYFLWRRAKVLMLMFIFYVYVYNNKNNWREQAYKLDLTSILQSHHHNRSPMLRGTRRKSEEMEGKCYYRISAFWIYRYIYW